MADVSKIVIKFLEVNLMVKGSTIKEGRRRKAFWEENMREIYEFAKNAGWVEDKDRLYRKKLKALEDWIKQKWPEAGWIKYHHLRHALYQHRKKIGGCFKRIKRKKIKPKAKPKRVVRRVAKKKKVDVLTILDRLVSRVGNLSNRMDRYESRMDRYEKTLAETNSGNKVLSRIAEKLEKI